LRILIFTYETPAYPAAGGQGRLHSLIEPLAPDHTIRVISTGGTPPFGRPPSGVEVRLVEPKTIRAMPPGPWLSKNVRHYLSGMPWLYGHAQHNLDAIAEMIGPEVSSFKPDVVMIEHEELTPLLSLLPSSMPAVIDFQNVLLDVERQNRERGIKGAIKGALESRVLARAERRALARAERTVVVSDDNRRTLSRLAPAAPIALVANPLDVEYFSRSGPPGDSPVYIFTASYHYPPNQEAVAHLLDEIVPRVLARVPDAELRLVGQRMPDELRRRAEATPGVTFVGMVDDVRPELQRAWVALAPLRMGSGSPLKAVEALAMGVPVVATARVAGSLEMGPDRGLVVADDPADFAAAVADLLSDRTRRERLGAAGVEAVRARFDRRVIARQLEAEFIAAAGTKVRA